MIITLTAGHSATDPGAVRGKHTEATLMLDLRNRVAIELEALGHTVRTDGLSTENLSLRNAMALIKGSAIAVELHTNASDNPEATGVEVVAMPEAKYRAQHIARAISAALGLRLRGDKGWINQSQTHRGRLGFVATGGLIAECFFLSNPSDLEAYLNHTNILAHALALGIVMAAEERIP